MKKKKWYDMCGIVVNGKRSTRGLFSLEVNMMKKILIVEDELFLLNLLHAQLTEKGYTVLDATDGKTGLEKAIHDKPDLILLDIKLPIMDGLTMLYLLRKEKVGKK